MTEETYYEWNLYLADIEEPVKIYIGSGEDFDEMLCNLE
jgi:hypothetical protein